MTEIHNDLSSLHNNYDNFQAVSAKVGTVRPTTGSDVPVFFTRPPETSATEREIDVARGSERVLLVDDDPVLRRHGALFLQALGYQVKVCTDGFAAIDMIFRDHERFDLLLTDVSMPGMDGRVLAARVQTLRPEIKVLFTSGHRKETLFPFSDEYEQVRFLTKPYSASELATALRQVLDS